MSVAYGLRYHLVCESLRALALPSKSITVSAKHRHSQSKNTALRAKKHPLNLIIIGETAYLH